MVKVRVALNQCDLCGRREPEIVVESYTITAVGRRRVSADLCEEDATPLLELLDKLPEAGRVPAGRQVASKLFATPDEIPRKRDKKP